MVPDVVTPEDADAVARHVVAAVRQGVASVVGLGGDGTQRAIAAVLAGTDVPLGILPGGTGNILGGVLGVPTGLQAAIGSLATAQPRAIDIGDVSLYTTDLEPGAPPLRTITAIGCGMGFDARLMATTPKCREGPLRPVRLPVPGDPAGLQHPGRAVSHHGRRRAL